MIQGTNRDTYIGPDKKDISNILVVQVNKQTNSYDMSNHAK